MLVLFDLNGTLLSLEAVRDALTGSGLPADLLEQWFTRLLQSAQAATLADRYRRFADFAEPALAQTLTVRGLPPGAGEPALAAMERLAPYPDAAHCLDALRTDGHRLAVLTNSPADVARGHLDRAGLLDRFEEVVSCDEVRAAKPAPAPYRHALRRLRADAAETAMVAGHGWDVLGAASVGMRTVWVRRTEQRWPLPGHPPGAAVDTLAEVPGALVTA